MELARALAVLLGAAAALTLTSEILVDALEPTVEALGHQRAVRRHHHHSADRQPRRARRRRDARLQEQDGLQPDHEHRLGNPVALFATPVLVFFGLFVGNPLTLVFTPLEVVGVAVGVFIASYIALDGRSNWVEGLS